MNSKSSPTVVPIAQVINANDSSRPTVRRMMAVLERQGQIEPLQVQVYAPNIYITFHGDAHGNDIVQAATLLGWSTLLIVEMKKYEN